MILTNSIKLEIYFYNFKCIAIKKGGLIEYFDMDLQAVRSSVVRAFAHVQCVVGSILHGGPIELFLVPASAPRLV